MAQKGGYSGSTHLGASQGCGANADVGVASEALTSSKKAIAVYLKAAEGNTGIIYYQVDGSAASSTNGVPLGAGDVTPWFPVPGNDLANITVIATVNGEDVHFHWMA